MPFFIPQRATQSLVRFCNALTQHPTTAAAVTDFAGTLSYGQLLARANKLQQQLTPFLSSAQSHRIALFLSPQSTFLTALLATWGLRATAVPLSPLYPPHALSPLLEDSQPTVIIAEHATFHGLPEHVHPLVVLPDEQSADFLEPIASADSAELVFAPDHDDKALLMFTSGTTGRAKGVVWTHSMIDYQVSTLSHAWHWSRNDHILNVLPLHHIHGLVNVVLTSIYNGAHLEMLPSFSAKAVWAALLRNEFTETKPPTVFMAVPAIYTKLIEYYNSALETDQNAMRAAASKVRLFVCGSASLARRDFDAWTAISGRPLLERYGMTETGMTLSNLYDQRLPGVLGYPLPGVEARIDSGPEYPNQGMLHVRGPGVFREYWRRPEETKKAFTPDGWFETGDVVERDEKAGYFRMLGRASSDIIKTGGYKVSAIEIEEVLRDCAGIKECCVVGVNDDVLGESIVAAIVSSVGESIIPTVQTFARKHLPKYKVPRRFLVVDDFPRNVLGKVQKKVLRSRLEGRMTLTSL